jgi:mono/diheme cytochrome c family protein
MTLSAQKLLVALLSLALFAALIAAGGIDARRAAEARRRAEAALDDAANPKVARGRRVFEKYSCIACHGARGVGGVMNLNAETGGQVPGLLHVAETYTPAELAEAIRNGFPAVGKADPTGPDPPLHMPGFHDLIGGQELTDLVSYLFSLGPPVAAKGDSAW